MKLKEARANIGMSQRGFAKKCGVAYTTISRIENGKNKKPNHNTRGKLTKALGVDSID